VSWDELPVVVTVAPVGAEVARADACELVRSLGRRPKTIDEVRELLACPVR